MAECVTKPCIKCSRVLPLDEFHRHPSTRDGHQGTCKDCVRENVRLWNEANPEKVRENRRRWKAANREKVLESARRFREANREKRREESRRYSEEHREDIRRYREEHREEARERTRQWREANPEKTREAVSRWQQEQARTVFTHYSGTGPPSCACCGATKRLSIDHVHGGGKEHRIALFGKEDAGGPRFYYWLIKNGFPDGYQVLCMPCNASKGTGMECTLWHDTSRSMAS
jgi:hypothetical protein